MRFYTAIWHRWNRDSLHRLFLERAGTALPNCCGKSCKSWQRSSWPHSKSVHPWQGERIGPQTCRSRIFSGDSVPRPLGFIALMPIPDESGLPLGLSSLPSPSLVLAPESALSLLRSRGLSSAPVARSVSATAILCKGGTKKSLTIAALSDMRDISRVAFTELHWAPAGMRRFTSSKKFSNIATWTEPLSSPTSSGA